MLICDQDHDVRCLIAPEAAFVPRSADVASRRGCCVGEGADHDANAIGHFACMFGTSKNSRLADPCGFWLDFVPCIAAHNTEQGILAQQVYCPGCRHRTGKPCSCLCTTVSICVSPCSEAYHSSVCVLPVSTQPIKTPTCTGTVILGLDML